MCPYCTEKGKIAESTIPTEGRDLACPKCKKSFFVPKTLSSKLDSESEVDKKREPVQQEPVQPNTKCSMCESVIEDKKVSKLLGREYCVECISKIHLKRKETLKKRKKEEQAKREQNLLEQEKVKEEKEKILKEKEREKEEKLKKRIEREKRKKEKQKAIEEAIIKRRIESEKYPLDLFKNDISENGISSIILEDFPLRLKRQESLYFISGIRVSGVFLFSLVLTNQRLFRVESYKPLYQYYDKYKYIRMVAGIRSLPLSGVIAIDPPVDNYECTEWEISIHLDKGSSFSLIFKKCQDSRRFCAMLTEMVDRINDPIDESSLAPKRERISDEIKIAVWRRDGGVCVSCGSRSNLEYDHIIPVSRGGSNTLRNIELLCEQCNRKKSNKIG